MTNMTIAIPAEIHTLMKKYSEVKWSEIARKAVEQKVKELMELEEKRDPLRKYALKHALDSGWSAADELFEF